ncbi:MAG: tRNA dihydrouridine synthase [Synergistales bacterium]
MSEREKNWQVIGNLSVEGRLWLAPLAGITIPAVRRFFREMGASLTHTEMVSSSGLLMKNRKTMDMLKNSEKEDPLVLQLFAGDAKSLLQSAEIAMSKGVFSAFSVNMACPVPKVRKRGAGAQLLYKRDLAAEMVRELKKSGLPVWPKIRKHPSGGGAETFSFCEALFEAGADLVCLHGRTPQELYGGVADKDVVKASAGLFPGKIAASGDVFERQDAEEYLEAGAVAVLVARGALRDPFIFSEAVSPAAPLERALFLVRLGDQIEQENGPRASTSLIKRFVSGMFKGMRGNAAYRKEVALSSDWTEMRKRLCACIHYFLERGYGDA